MNKTGPLLSGSLQSSELFRPKFDYNTRVKEISTEGPESKERETTKNKHKPQRTYFPPYPFFSPAPREMDPGRDQEDCALIGKGHQICELNTFTHSFGVKYSCDHH